MKTLSIECFYPDVIDMIINNIEDNEGNEVSFAGKIDETGKIYKIEALAFGNEDSVTIDDLEVLQADVLIHNHPSGNLTPSSADIQMATQLSPIQLGFYIIDNLCEIVHIVQKSRSKIFLDTKKVHTIFENKGNLSSIISFFEDRKEQLALVDKITKTINGESLLLAEAGTGTGKSLAYLIPTALWAIENKKRVLISTHTIPLQTQIAKKDMEIVKQVIYQLTGQTIDYTVLVGRSNYICIKNLEELTTDFEKQSSLFSEDDHTAFLLDFLTAWINKSEDGLREELKEPIPHSIWEEISADTINCQRKKCPFYEKCFYYKARLAAERSNLIIANHALVFSSLDMSSFHSSLPHVKGLVFDEAHHVEESFLNAMSNKFSYYALLYHLRKLYYKKGRKETGLLVLLLNKSTIEQNDILNLDYEKLLISIKSLISLCSEQEKSIKEEALKQHIYGNFSLDNFFKHSSFYKLLFSYLDKLFNEIHRLCFQLEEFVEKVQKIENNKELNDTLHLIHAKVENLLELKRIFNEIFNNKTENLEENEDSDTTAKWGEITKRNIQFHNTPVDINSLLVNALFSRKAFTILTSATLQIQDQFRFYKNSLGLEYLNTKEILDITLPSPFDYQKQARLYITRTNTEFFSENNKLRFLKEICLLTEGGTLILFTSFQKLQETYDALKEDLTKAHLRVLKQGEYPRDQILEKMRSHSNVILFATSTFWEGIDVPGNNLRCVIIEKLPFDNPSDPFYKAKTASLSKKGQNPFMDYSLPRAILKLKQGIGRLIRTQKDKGVIILMDDRVKTKRYGSKFLESLPPVPTKYLPYSEILTETKCFFDEHF